MLPSVIISSVNYNGHIGDITAYFPSGTTAILDGSICFVR